MTRRRDQADPESISTRTLPHNLEAERSVIGAILVHNEAFLEAARHIRSTDFFRAAHAKIFASIERVMERPGASVDLVTIKEELGRRGELDEVGGPAYIASLADGVPRSANVAHYAGIVRDKALLRALIVMANTVITDAYCAEELGTEILARADQAIVALQHGAASGRMQSTAATAGALMEALEYRVRHRGQLSGVETGFPSINDMTGGWQAGDMIVIAARPSIGKTTFVMNAAMAAARSGARPAIFSMEMRRLQLELRMIASLSAVPLSVLLGGWVKEDQWKPISDALAVLQEARLYIDDSGSRTVRDIRSECRRLKAEGDLGLVVIDYVQLMQGSLDRRSPTRNEELTDISRRLKVMADEVQCPVIVLSQLNRAGEGRSDPRPKLSDLRETGALEQDADLVCFLHRKHHRESGTTQFIIEKQRNGPTGTVNLTIDRDTTNFTDGGEEVVETPAERQAEDQDAKIRAIIRQRGKR